MIDENVVPLPKYYVNIENMKEKELITNNLQKIAALEGEISKMGDSKKEIADKYINGEISQSEMSQNIIKLKNDESECKSEIIALYRENERLYQQIIKSLEQ